MTKKSSKKAEEKLKAPIATQAKPDALTTPGQQPEPTQAQIGFHNICGKIRTANPCPMTIDEFNKWAAPVFDAINKQAEAERVD